MMRDMACRLGLLSDMETLSAAMGQRMYPSENRRIQDASIDLGKMQGNDAKRVAAACVLHSMQFVLLGL